MLSHTQKLYPIYVIIDVFVLAALFFLLQACCAVEHHSEYGFILALWIIFTYLFFKRRNLYSTDRSLTIPRELSRVFVSTCYVGILLSAIIFFAKYHFVSRKFMFLYAVGVVVCLGGWRAAKRLFVRYLITKGYHNVNILFVGNSLSGKIFHGELKRMPWLGFTIAGFLSDSAEEKGTGAIPYLGRIDEFESVVKKHFIDEIVITENLRKGIISEILNKATDRHMAVRVIPDTFLEPLPIVEISRLGITPLLTYKKRLPVGSDLRLKYAIDSCLALVLLVILFPLLCLIGIAICIDSPGPVLYMQKRVGLKGRSFSLYKFRSMVVAADNLKKELMQKNEIKDGIIFKIKKDPRVTRFGRIIRKYSLDELPQLFNVLKGDMSLVGPRPPVPDEVLKYKVKYMKRLSVRPGITGLAQIRGRSDLTFNKWVRWDSWYVDNWSLGLDFKILWLTIPAVCKGKGAY